MLKISKKKGIGGHPGKNEAPYTYGKSCYKGSLIPEKIESQMRVEYSHQVKYLSGGFVTSQKVVVLYYENGH